MLHDQAQGVRSPMPMCGCDEEAEQQSVVGSLSYTALIVTHLVVCAPIIGFAGIELSCQPAGGDG